MTTLLALGLCLATPGPGERPRVLIVVGAPGTPEYAGQFRAWADRWQAAAEKGGADVVRIGGADEHPGTDRDRLRASLAEAAGKGQRPVWLIMIGHGTFDGREAKFNLRGPDISDRELAGWLAPVKGPVAVIDCSSSSGPFLARLSGEGRVVITATRSGHEQNFARFGRHLAEAIDEPRADLDKDGQVSLLEAFVAAGHRVAEEYRGRGQLATEHALLDDNGDGLGTPADWFRGVRASKRAKDGASLDGTRAHQLHLVPSDRERGMPAAALARRDQLERSLATLREEKSGLPEVEYYRRLERLMIELARIYIRPASKPQPAGEPSR